MSNEERAAVEAFDQSVGTRRWFDPSDPEVAEAWQRLVGQIGAARGVLLLRQREAAGSAGWESRLGRIAILPERVALFGVSGGAVVELGQGVEITETLRYNPEALRPGNWLAGFQEAVARGMGLKLTQPQQVQAALDADWIVAVGLHRGDAVQEMETLLRDAVANGSFEFLPQDAPTNNSPTARSMLGAGSSDPVAYLSKATHLEQGLFDTPLQRASDLLAEALGIDATVTRQAVRAGDTAFEDARAMVRVVGPALLDGVAGSLTVFQGVGDDDLVDFFAACVAARGTLPAVRFGSNPYGLLPVTRLDELEDVPGDGQTEQAIDRFIRAYASVVRRAQVPRARRGTPILEPDDPEASDKLGQILRQNPVSRRVMVADAGSSDAEALGCPYVAGPRYAPANYLRALRLRPLKELRDPTQADRATPLLYRLTRLSLVKGTLLSIDWAERPRMKGTEPTLRRLRIEAEKGRRGDTYRIASQHSVAGLAVASAVPEVPVVVWSELRRTSQTLDAALMHLEAVARRRDGTAALEKLLMETLDLFQHRMDAWAAGLAHRRLAARRRAGGTGLQAGYYGFIGKLRATAITGRTDGFIQAPSPAQAATSALLRSAHLRFRGQGAFTVDLPSRRVRRALRILDLVSKGLPVEEVLGLRGERWLHNRQEDRLVFLLREQFPLRNRASGESLEMRLFDGRAFLNSRLSFAGSAADRRVLEALQAELQDDLDAFSDLVMCEATHRRGLRQVEAANAWLQVLSGHPVPGEPSFLRTQREGHGSSHRLAVVLPPATPPANASPREVAEPRLAALARRTLRGFAQARVEASLTVPGGTPLRRQVRLARDLGMTPLDLVVGGPSEVTARVRHYLIRRWQTNAAMEQSLGPLPAQDVGGYLDRERPLSIHVDVGNPSAEELFHRAGLLRAAVLQGRALEPTDMNAAALPAATLDESTDHRLWNGAAAALRQRATDLADKLTAHVESARGALGSLLVRARNHRLVGDRDGALAALAASLQSTEQGLETLHDAMASLVRYAEPEALRVYTIREVVADPEGFAASVALILDRLETKATRLRSALASTATPATGLREARGAVAALTKALADALDGEGMPILPPFERVGATMPVIDSSVAPATALGDWADVREKVQRALDLAELVPLQAHLVSARATDDEAGDPSADIRAAEIAPRTRFFGVFLSSGRPATGVGDLAGFVVDEWSEQRPSRLQTTGLAINYDSPQSEAPHCLLLCEPPSGSYQDWTPTRAAGMVWETIQWMMARALSTEDNVVPAALLPNANQVAFKMAGRRLIRRIPGQHLLGSVLGWQDGSFVVRPKRHSHGIDATGISEVSRFTTIDE